MEWKLLTFLVCCFGFCKDLRPSEAYMTTFLTSHWKNLTLDQVNNEIYPWWTYSYAIWLVPVFIFTDYFRYRSLLILDASAYITTWVLILWAQGLPAMTIMQVSYGLATAGEIGYFSYLYSMVDRKHFQKVASFTRCSSLAGRFTAYLLGQFLISYDVLDLFELNAFSFSSVSLAFAISIVLPKSKTSDNTDDVKLEVGSDNVRDSQCDKSPCNNHVGIGCTAAEREGSYVNDANVSDLVLKPTTDSTENADGINDTNTTLNPISDLDIETTEVKHQTKRTDGNTDAFSKDKVKCESSRRFENAGNYKSRIKSLVHFLNMLKEQIKQTYSTRTVIVWSVWWITASCGNLQIGSYIQNLWEAISPHKESSTIYNGAVEAGGTLTGSLCVVLVGFLPVKWSRTGRSEALMASVCLIKAIILVVMATTTEIWVAYILYDVFRVLYQVTITIEIAEIAKALTSSNYAFVFGCNMFLALVIESIFTAVVVDQSGFGVDVRTQFLAYGGYSAALSVIFFIVTIVTVCNRSQTGPSKVKDTEIWSTSL